MRPNREVPALWNRVEIETCVIDESLFRTPVRLIDTGDEPSAPSFYLVFFDPPPAMNFGADRDLARSTRLYAPARGYPLYVGSAANGRERLARHCASTRPVTSLAGGAALTVINIPVPSHADALYAEALAIEFVRPVWNVVARGFGSRVQGARRSSQIPPRWSQIHPGRRTGTGPPDITAARLRRMVAEHLAATAIAGMWPTG